MISTTLILIAVIGVANSIFVSKKVAGNEQFCLSEDLRRE